MLEPTIGQCKEVRLASFLRDSCSILLGINIIFFLTRPLRNAEHICITSNVIVETRMSQMPNMSLERMNHKAKKWPLSHIY